MKKISLVLFLLFALFTMLSSAQTAAEKKIISTLGPDEKLANGENCFLMDRNPESVSFVTVVGSGDNKQYYCYGKDGKKTGPVKSPDPSYWLDCKDVEVEDCVPNDEPRQGDLQESIDWTTGAVKFQGKTYGPYGQVMSFYLSEDGKNFFAVALSAEMKIIFFDNNNRKLELVNVPEEVILSPDGTRAYAKVKGSINPFEPGAMEKMMNNPEEMNNPKINLFGIDGTKFGPFTSNDYHDAWFIAPAKLVIYNANDVSLDGKLIFKSEDYISPCDMWLSSNGKDYAWANYQQLIFSDGSKYVAPLVILHTDGYLKWISLEDGKNLVLYRKAF